MSENFTGYTKFFGPSVDDGKIDPAILAKHLAAVGRLYSKYKVITGRRDPLEIKVKSIKKNCTEIDFVIQLANATYLDESAGLLLAFKSIGVDEFAKAFFRTLGDQAALKVLSKGLPLNENKKFVEGKCLMVEIQNANGETKVVPEASWGLYRQSGGSLQDLIPLRQKKEDALELGYYEGGESFPVSRVSVEDKKYLGSSEDTDIEARLNEGFDETNAKEEKITGRFVDYYGLAHKYFFSFQARKNQDRFGKQKILCMVEEDSIDDLLDLLKPKNQKDVTVFGLATRDFEGRVDKMKIQWFSENEDFNPNQGTL